MALRINLAAKKLLAIDWDNREVRAVMFRPKADGIDLLKAVSIPVPPTLSLTDAEAMGAFLREALRQARMNVKQALLTIPRDRVVLNTLRLPPTPAEEMAAMVGFQVSKELPFSAEQATIDFAVQGTFDAKMPVDILVAAIRNEELEFFRKVAHEAGLSLESIGLRPHGNLVAVTTRAEATGTLMIVEVGPQLTEIDIVKDGVLAFSRAASVAVWQPELPPADDRIEDSRISTFPVQDREPDESSRKSVSSVLLEVVRSYEAYRATDPAMRVGRIVVSGASGIEAELATALGSRFAVRAELYSADAALDLSPQRAKELRGFSAVLGLAMNHGAHGLSHFDFLHPKKTVSKRTKQMRKAPVAIAAAIAFVLTGVSIRYWAVRPVLLAKEQELAALNTRKKEADALEDFKSKIEAVQTWQADEQRWNEVLVKLTEAFPPDEQAYASRLMLDTKPPQRRMGRQSVMTVSLRTSTSDAVNELVAKMKELGFDDVTPGRTSETTPLSGYRFDSSVTASIPRRKVTAKPAGQTTPTTAPVKPEPTATKPAEPEAANSPVGEVPKASSAEADVPKNETEAAPTTQENGTPNIRPDGTPVPPSPALPPGRARERGRAMSPAGAASGERGARP